MILSSRMGKVVRTLSVRKADCKGFGGSGRLSIVGGYLPDPASVRTNIRLETHFGGDWQQRTSASGMADFSQVANG